MMHVYVIEITVISHFIVETQHYYCKYYCIDNFLWQVMIVDIYQLKFGHEYIITGLSPIDLGYHHSSQHKTKNHFDIFRKTQSYSGIVMYYTILCTKNIFYVWFYHMYFKIDCQIPLYFFCLLYTSALGPIPCFLSVFHI